MNDNIPNASVRLSDVEYFCRALGLNGTRDVTEISVGLNAVTVTLHRVDDKGHSYLGHANATAKVTYDIAIDRPGVSS